MKSLSKLYSEHKGKVSVKWSSYLAKYDNILSDIRNKKIRILEIGVQNGGSLEIWSKYFIHAKVFIGCDIDHHCARLKYSDKRISIVTGDANIVATEEKILKNSPRFDLIIDDGSHFSGDIIRAFARYFGHLDHGGIYIVEDLHCSYYPEYDGGLYCAYSSMAFFKKLADIVNFEFWGQGDINRILEGFSKKYALSFDTNQLAEIHSIEFSNSLCIIRKQDVSSNYLGNIVVAGIHEDVVSGHKDLSGFIPQQLLSGCHSLRQDIRSSKEVWERLSEKLSERDEKIGTLKQDIAERDSQLRCLDEYLKTIYSSMSWKVTLPLRAITRLFRKRTFKS